MSDEKMSDKRNNKTMKNMLLQPQQDISSQEVPISRTISINRRATELREKISRNRKALDEMWRNLLPTSATRRKMETTTEEGRDFHPSKDLRSFETSIMTSSSVVTPSAPTDLAFSQSFNFSSSEEEELEEPKEVLTPDLSDHEGIDGGAQRITDSPRSENFHDEPAPPVPPSPVKTTNKQEVMTSPSPPRHQYEHKHKPHPPPRIYRRAQQQNRHHCDVKSPPVPKMRNLNNGDVTPATNNDVIEKKATTGTEGKQKPATSSSGYSSPGSRSASISPSSSSASSSSSSFKPSLSPVIKSKPLTNGGGDDDVKKFSPRTRSKVESAALLWSSSSGGDSTSEPMKALPIPELNSPCQDQPPQVSKVPDLNRQDSVASSTASTRVDYTMDVKLPSGNTICFVEDANSLARHKQQSATLSGQPVVRRRRDGWKHGATSFDQHDSNMTSSSSHRRGANSEQRRSVPSFPFSFSRNSNHVNNHSHHKKNAGANEWNYISEKDFSASLANLAKAAAQSEPLAPSDGSGQQQQQRPFSTISVAAGRRMSERGDDFGGNSNHLPRSNVPHTGSLWSLNFASGDNKSLDHNFACPQHPAPKRRPSIKHRLKGAFSFQNIRRAISMERVAEEEPHHHNNHKSGNSKTSDSGETPSGSRDNIFSGTLRKAPSITSIISTVRMRKRKSKNRSQHRNTIAIDTFNLENIAEKERLSSTVRSSIHIGRPNYFRPIGRVLNINAIEGTVLVEIVRPPSGPYGFYLGRHKDNKNVYISSLNDGYPEKMYAGLMQLGDEVTEINGIGVDGLSLDAINDIIIDSIENVRLRVKPGKVHRV